MMSRGLRSSFFLLSLVVANVGMNLASIQAAHASRARLISLGQAGPAANTYSNLVLGQGGTASLYIEDQRSIFINPAYLHKFASMANFEMGSSTVGSAPNAEGGIFVDNGDIKYGIQLGRESGAASMIANANTLLGIAGTAAESLALPDSAVEAMVAGGGATKWGASVLFATSDDKDAATNGYPNKKANTLELRGGVIQDKMQAYGRLMLLSSSETEVSATATNKFDSKPGIEGGVTFDLKPDQKAWGTLGLYSYSARYQTQGASSRDGSITVLSGGVTQFLTPEAITRLFVSGGLTFSKNNLKGVGATAEYNQERIYFPIVIGLENQAWDWMTIRASVRQNVLFDQTKNSNTTDLNTPNTTVVSAGTGFKWKRLLLDAVLAGAVAGTGNIDGNSLLTRAGLTYSF